MMPLHQRISGHHHTTIWGTHNSSIIAHSHLSVDCATKKPLDPVNNLRLIKVTHTLNHARHDTHSPPTQANPIGWLL